MTTNTIHTTRMQQLIERIRKPMLFYVSSILFNHLDKEKIENLKSIGVLDSIVIIKTNGAVEYVNKGINEIELLEKENLLKSNLFVLLQQQSELDNTTFQYLLSEYFRELNAWVDYTQIIQQEIAQNNNATISNYNKKLKPYLILQHNALKAHKDKCLTHFNAILNNTEYNNNAKNHNRILDIILDNSTAKRNKAPKNNNLITNQEADNYLLSSIFSVKM